MDLNNFSLLYPNTETKRAHYHGENRPNMDAFVLDELGLSDMIPLKNSELTEYFTTDPEVIAYRLEAFSDMLDNPSISATLQSLIPILGDILELRRLEADSGNVDSYLSSMTEIELYISCIDLLHSGFSALKEKLTSRAYRLFAARIEELAES